MIKEFERERERERKDELKEGKKDIVFVWIPLTKLLTKNDYLVGKEEKKL